jgi:hypothetical protein
MVIRKEIQVTRCRVAGKETKSEQRLLKAAGVFLFADFPTVIHFRRFLFHF